MGIVFGKSIDKTPETVGHAAGELVQKLVEDTEKMIDISVKTGYDAVVEGGELGVAIANKVVDETVEVVDKIKDAMMCCHHHTIKLVVEFLLTNDNREHHMILDIHVPVSAGGVIKIEEKTSDDDIKLAIERSSKLVGLELFKESMKHGRVSSIVFISLSLHLDPCCEYDMSRESVHEIYTSIYKLLGSDVSSLESRSTRLFIQGFGDHSTIVKDNMIKAFANPPWNLMIDEVRIKQSLSEQDKIMGYEYMNDEWHLIKGIISLPSIVLTPIVPVVSIQT